MTFKRIITFFFALIIGGGAMVGTADAAVTNCSKQVTGRTGSSYCASTNSNPPYTTQHIISVLCVRPWYLGGGSTERVGYWANVGNTSVVLCPQHYSATDPRILFR